MTVLAVLFTLHVKEYGMYQWQDMVEAIGCSFIAMLGNVTLSHSLSIGLGGPVQGIVNLMSIVHLLWALFLLDQQPTLLQSLGLSLGLFGAMIICGLDKIFTARD